MLEAVSSIISRAKDGALELIEEAIEEALSIPEELTGELRFTEDDFIDPNWEEGYDYV